MNSAPPALKCYLMNALQACCLAGMLLRPRLVHPQTSEFTNSFQRQRAVILCYLFRNAMVRAMTPSSFQITAPRGDGHTTPFVLTFVLPLTCSGILRCVLRSIMT